MNTTGRITSADGSKIAEPIVDIFRADGTKVTDNIAAYLGKKQCGYNIVRGWFVRSFDDTWGWMGGVVTQDKKLVVFVPYMTRRILLYNVAENRTYLGPSIGFDEILGEGPFFCFGVCATNGKIIFGAYGAGCVGIYDPETNTYKNGAELPYRAPYNNYRVTPLINLPDGNIFHPLYTRPYNENVQIWTDHRIGIYDPRIDSFVWNTPIPRGALDYIHYPQTVWNLYSTPNSVVNLGGGRILFGLDYYPDVSGSIDSEGINCFTYKYLIFTYGSNTFEVFSFRAYADQPDIPYHIDGNCAYPVLLNNGLIFYGSRYMASTNTQSCVLFDSSKLTPSDQFEFIKWDDVFTPISDFNFIGCDSSDIINFHTAHHTPIMTPSQKIILPPRQGNYALIVDPYEKTVTRGEKVPFEKNVFGRTDEWCRSAVLLDDNRVVFVPYQAPNVWNYYV